MNVNVYWIYWVYRLCYNYETKQLSLVSRGIHHRRWWVHEIPHQNALIWPFLLNETNTDFSCALLNSHGLGINIGNAVTGHRVISKALSSIRIPGAKHHRSWNHVHFTQNLWTVSMILQFLTAQSSALRQQISAAYSTQSSAYWSQHVIWLARRNTCYLHPVNFVEPLLLTFLTFCCTHKNQKKHTTACDFLAFYCKSASPERHGCWPGGFSTETLKKCILSPGRNAW